MIHQNAGDCKGAVKILSGFLLPLIFSRSGDEGQLLSPGQGLDLPLPGHGRRRGGAGLPVGQGHRQVGSGVAPALPRLVGLQPPGQVVGPAGVQAALAAAEDVNAVHFPSRKARRAASRGTSPARAAAARSSYSGLLFSTPYPAPAFRRTGPHSVSTGGAFRSTARAYRAQSTRRTPKVVVWRRISAASRSPSSGRHRHRSRTPGRPFFIWRGIQLTSRAPAARSRYAAKPRSSPVMSSILARSSVTVSLGPW